MGNNNAESRARAPLDGPEKIEAALAQVTSNLWGAVKRAADSDRWSLSVTCRGSRDWLAVARASSEDGSPVVCFGNSESFAGAIVALNASIGKNAWHVDKFAVDRAARAVDAPNGKEKQLHLLEP